MKRQNIITALFFCCALFSVSLNVCAQKVTKVWETPAQLNTCESVCYNPVKNEYYVSNINGSPAEKDGKGFIAIITDEGNIKNLNWITGLNAPKGMGVFQDKLYVADLDVVVEISISEGKISRTYKLTDSNSLNDIAVDGNGTVYVSSPGENAIYRIKSNRAEKWLSLEGYSGPNGIYVEGAVLLIGVNDHILKVNPDDQSVEVYIAGTGSIDGLEAVGDSYYIISDWQGRTHLVHPGNEKIKLTDTTGEENVNAADIEYRKDQNLLVIPTFFNNSVIAYQFEQ